MKKLLAVIVIALVVATAVWVILRVQLANRLKTVPLKFSLALNKLPPGRYDCQVTVLDPAGQKAAFWQAPIVLTQ